MPSFTPYLNLYKPGGGSSGLIAPDEVADVDRLNADLDLIDANALAQFNRSKKFPLNVPDQATRDAWYPAPANGDRVWRADLNREQLYMNSKWRFTDGTVISTSVSGGTQGADGKIALAGTTNVQLNGAFSSDFLDYEVILDLTLGAPADFYPLARVGVGGVPAGAGSDYHYNVVDGESGVVRYGGGPFSGVPLLRGASGQRMFGTLRIGSPNVAGARTTMKGDIMGGVNTAVYIINIAGQRATAQADTDFILATAGTTMTGTILVRGIV